LTASCLEVGDAKASWQVAQSDPIPVPPGVRHGSEKFEGVAVFMRDYFVHRLFHDGAWPGDLDEHGCRSMTRRLIAIQLWLARAERNVWSIFERARFFELDRLEDGSLLATNMGIYDPKLA
jgi:hypothetical protein